MELGTLRRDMAAIDGGRWVAKGEVPDLLDIRVKAKGLGGSEARETLAKLQRDGVPDADAIQRVVNEVCFVEIEGLTNGGKPVVAADIRDQLADPAMEPLALLILKAVQRVDATREAQAEALSKN